MQSNKFVVYVQHLREGVIERAKVEHKNIRIGELKQLLFGGAGTNLVAIQTNGVENLSLIQDELQSLSDLQNDPDQEIVLTFREIEDHNLNGNPVINIREHDRLIAELIATDAQIIFFDIGNYFEGGQEHPLFVQQLQESGYSVHVFNLDQKYQASSTLNPNKFGVLLEPDQLKTQELLAVIKQKMAEGKKFILFDHTSVRFSDFTTLIASHSEQYGLWQHDNFEVLVGRKRNGKDLIPPVFCSVDLFTKADGQNPAQLMMQNYPFQPEGQTYQQRSEKFKQTLNCELFDKTNDIPTSLLFTRDKNFVRYPEQDILSAFAGINDSKMSVRKFVVVFDDLLPTINSLTAIEKLIPIVSSDKFRLKDITPSFFTDKKDYKEHVRTKIGEWLENYIDKEGATNNSQRIIDLADKINYHSDNLTALKQQRSP